jgi:hypothetical protein
LPQAGACARIRPKFKEATMAMKNMPEVRMGLVGVSRDCFPAELTRRRLAALTA